MDTNQLKACWQELSDDIKHQWKRLTDEDLLKINGRKGRFIVVIQQKYGLARKHARKSVDKFISESSLS